jgi:putative lipoic acid-binding regulatory protein
MYHNLDDYQVEISYPCPWQYTVIGLDREAIRLAVADVVGSAEYCLAPSHTSRTGKYCSMHLSLTVETEEHRIGLFHALKEHPAIQIVI